MSDIQENNQNQNQAKNKKSCFEAREETKLTLRKKKLDNRLMVKRQLLRETSLSSAIDLEIDINTLNIPKNLLEMQCEPLENLLPTINKLFISSKIDEVKFILFLIRKFTMTLNSPIHQLYDSNIVDIVLTILKNNHNDNSIVYECLWILINISFKIDRFEFVKYLLSNHCFSLWETIIQKDNNPLTINLLWLLNHLAISQKELTRLIFESNFFISYLIPMLNKENVKKSILSISISTIIVGIDYLADEKYRNLFEPIVKIFCLYHVGVSEDITFDCITGLAILSNNANHSIITIIFTCGIIRRIVTREITTNSMNQHFILQLIGNFLSYFDENLIDPLFNKEIVLYLKTSLINTNDSITRKNAAWCLSNICGGTINQIKEVINTDVVPILINIIREDHYPTTKEALYCISNMICCGEVEIIFQMNSYNMIDLMLDTINKNTQENEMIGLCLESLNSIFEVGNKIKHYTNGGNLFLNTFDNKGGRDLLEQLVCHNDPTIHEIGKSMIQAYYNIA